MSTLITQQLPAARPEAPRLHLGWLDGMRGLSAFYIVIFHAYSLATVDHEGGSSESFKWATRGLLYGHYAVAVFIVLSGFCLMLPVARAQDRRLPGGLLGFAKRRARRILPPYYCALAITVGLLLASHRLVKHAAEDLADTSTGNIITHILLIHNLFERYTIQLDTPMWSVAWEWQIYFIFALILLPVWRRAGILWTVALGCTIGFSPLLLLPQVSNLSWTAPWYVGLFTFGMFAAVVLCSPRDRFGLIKNAVFQKLALSLTAVILVVLMFLRPQWLERNSYPVVDMIVGAFTALSILACAINSNSSWLIRMIVKGLEMPAIVTLGAFSYSLYLVHYLILQKMHFILHKHQYSDYLQFTFLTLIGVPICLFASYLFFLAFERPFLNTKKHETMAETARDAALLPAP